jgi:hypothetical protein
METITDTGLFCGAMKELTEEEQDAYDTMLVRHLEEDEELDRIIRMHTGRCPYNNCDY